MESIYVLIGICLIIFVLFSLKEVIKLRKDINKLNGIVNHLLKKEKEKSS